jgi:hypothetical protein
MLLKIHDNLLIEDIQEHFSKCFPNLKIEVYSRPHHWKKGSLEKDIISPRTPVGEIRKSHSSGVLEIKSSDKVGDVEKKFKKIFDLNVQIFRKEDDCWIQTTSTDLYTLEQEVELSKKSKTTLVTKIKEQADEYDFL